jgi:hypothetical protein
VEANYGWLEIQILMQEHLDHPTSPASDLESQAYAGAIQLVLGSFVAGTIFGALLTLLT